MDPMTVKWTSNDLKQNMKKAERAGIRIVERTGAFTREERLEIDAGVKNWKKGRKGPQVASAAMQPWLDEEHRRYWVAQTADQTAVGLMVLSRLKNNGYLIKISVVFPEAPRGTSELLNGNVIHALRDEGADMVTFGVSASETLSPISNVGGSGMMWLGKAYGGIIKMTGLTNRGTYRKKFGCREDKLYVAYPPSGLGWSGIQALMKMLSASN